MPRIKETTVYKYEELSDTAKERARNWYREANAGDNSFAEYITEDFHEVLKALGFDVDKKCGLSWSGFWSQGDGADFGGTWRASDCDAKALLKDRPIFFAGASRGEVTPCKHNEALHDIAEAITNCIADGLVFARLNVSNHGFFMSLDSAEHDQPEALTNVDEWTDHCTVNEARFIEAARHLADWFYKALEAEYQYQNSDEAIAESIIANDYEFTEEGRKA